MAIGPVKRAYIERVKAAEAAKKAGSVRDRPAIEREHETRRRRFVQRTFGTSFQRPPPRAADPAIGTILSGKIPATLIQKAGLPRGAWESQYGAGPRVSALDKRLSELTQRDWFDVAEMKLKAQSKRETQRAMLGRGFTADRMKAGSAMLGGAQGQAAQKRASHLRELEELSKHISLESLGIPSPTKAEEAREASRAGFRAARTGYMTRAGMRTEEQKGKTPAEIQLERIRQQRKNWMMSGASRAWSNPEVGRTAAQFGRGSQAARQARESQAHYSEWEEWRTNQQNQMKEAFRRGGVPPSGPAAHKVVVPRPPKVDRFGRVKAESYSMPGKGLTWSGPSPRLSFAKEHSSLQQFAYEMNRGAADRARAKKDYEEARAASGDLRQEARRQKATAQSYRDFGRNVRRQAARGRRTPYGTYEEAIGRKRYHRRESLILKDMSRAAGQFARALAPRPGAYSI